VIFLPSKKLKTKNIANSISKFAAEHVLNPSEYTFTINAIENHIKTTADNDFSIYKEDIHDYFNNPEKIINEHVRFKQIYTITIKKDIKPIIKLNYDIKYSDNNINPSIIIYPDSIIPYKKYKAKDIYILLVKELNKIKAQKKILIKIFDKSMTEKLKAFTKYIYQGKFVKKIRIPLFDGISPEITKSSKLIMHYKKKLSNLQVIEVDEKETLIEFRKPIFGKNGLNAFGEIVSNNHESNKDDIKSDIDFDTIEVVEDEKRKLYKSKIKGYIHFDENKFYIDNKIKMKKLSRLQENVAKDEDNNIEVVVAQNDTNVDSVGEGVELVSETIHISGHVGAKTKLEATNLIIDGATHGDSIQEAKFAQINRHKGKIRCHNAKVKLLEGGEIHATNVDVDAALGGSIYAENVTIGHVKNNLKIYASNSISIKKVSGEDNLFKMSYVDIPTLKSKCKFLTNELQDLKDKVEDVAKHSPKLVPGLKTKINHIKTQQTDIKNAVKSAKITIAEPLNGLNTIIFTIDEENELVFKTDARRYDAFYLEESDTHITLYPTNQKISIES